MGINPHYYFALAGGDADIQRTGCNPTRIVEQPDERVSVRIFDDDLPSAVLAHSVNDENFQLFLGKVINQEAVQAFSDELALVAAGNNDRQPGATGRPLCRVDNPSRVTPTYHLELPSAGSHIFTINRHASLPAITASAATSPV